jgi:DNA-binding NtrC family response regulator
MNAKMTVSQSPDGVVRSWTKPEPTIDAPWVLEPLPVRRSFWADPHAVKSLEETMESLVSAYLAANLNFRGIPLKEFMDNFEKQVLLAGLGLTQGHQRNAAAILGLKATALFEKMRKHGLNGRQLKLQRKLSAAPPLAEK